MTPEIDALDAEILNLREKREAMWQQVMAKKAIAQVGELINFGSANSQGRVIGFEDWAGGDISYKVVRIKKDGGDGGAVIVYPYQNLRRCEV